MTDSTYLQSQTESIRQRMEKMFKNRTDNDDDKKRRMKENVINYVCTSVVRTMETREKKRKTAVTRDNAVQARDRPSRLLSSDEDGGKGVPATRRPNRVGFRLGTRGMVGIVRIGIRWYRITGGNCLIPSGTCLVRR